MDPRRLSDLHLPDVGRRPGFPAFSLVLLVSLWPGTAATAGELVPVPAPSLVGMEQVVQDQLRDGLAEVESLAAKDETAPDELAGAYGRLGQVYLAYDLKAPAEACLRNAASLAPGEFRWPYLLGAHYQQERRLDEARARLEAALETDPRSMQALVRLGDVHLAAERPADAVAAFERALVVDPGAASAVAGLARAAAARRDFEAAAGFYERALEIAPDASALRYPLAITLRELGRIDDARRHLAARGDVDVPFDDPLTHALSELATGSGIRLMAGNRAMRRGDRAAAVASYRKALELNPRNAEARRALGGALLAGGDLDGALVSYAAAVEIEPDHPQSRYNLGTLQVRRGDLAGASEQFAAALELAPDYVDARFNLAGVLAEEGRWEEAWMHSRQLLELAPEDREIRFQAGRTLSALGRDREAHDLLSALLEELPAGAVERAAVHLELARIAARQGRLDEAARHFAAVVQARPEAAEPRFALAMALLLAERYEEARARLEEAVEALPASAELAHLLARFLATVPVDELRDGERALGLATALFRSQPRPDVAETVAMAYAEMGRFDEAVSWQRRLITEARRAGADGLLATLQERLALYEGGAPCRAPWLP